MRKRQGKTDRRERARASTVSHPADLLRHPAAVGVVILVVGLVTRLAFLAGSPDKHWPHSYCYEGDAPLWAFYAVCVQHGRLFEHGLPIHTPGMGYLLAWIWGGDVPAGFLPPKVLFYILGSLTCLLVWHSSRAMFGSRVGVIAGLLSAASFGLTVQSTSLNNETPYTLLLLAIIGLTLRVALRRSAVSLAVLALLHGLAVLFRAEHSLLFVMLCLYLAWRWWVNDRGQPSRRGARPEPGGSGAPDRHPRQVGIVLGLAILMGGIFLVPLPWNIRSYGAIQRVNTVSPRPVSYEDLRPPWTLDAVEYLRALPAFVRESSAQHIATFAASAGQAEVSREFVHNWFTREMGYVPQPLSPYSFVTNQGPLSFALANSARAEGGFSTALLDPNAPARLDFANPRHLRFYQQGYAVGLRYLREHPRDGLILFGRKLAIFSAGLTQGLSPWNLPLGVAGIRRPVDQLAPKPGTGRAWSGLVLLFGAVGVAVCVRRRIGAIWVIVLAYKVLVTLAFYGYARQAVSILPVFYVLVAVGIDAILLAPLLRKWPRLAKWEPRIADAVVVVALVAALTAGMREARYEVSGPVEPARGLGHGAFESHHLLEIRRTW